MTNSSSKQQQLQQQQYSNTLQSGSSRSIRQVYTNTYVHRAAAYIVIIIYQVKALCCETAHGVYVTKRSNNSNNTQSSSSGSSTMYAYKTDFSIAQTTPQSSSYCEVTLGVIPVSFRRFAYDERSRCRLSCTTNNPTSLTC